MKELGIYVHIPFCKSKCHYCAFNSKCNVEKEVIDRYFVALAKEILSKIELFSTSICTSIYFGGGTPSFVDAKYIEDVLKLLRGVCYVKEDAEITIEINPGTLDLEKAKKYKELGINRCSLGVQSLEDVTLKKIGRGHNKKDVIDALEILKEVGITNISCDYIFGLPDSSVEKTEKEILELTSLASKYNICHISCYDLEVLEGTKLDFLVKEGYVTLPDLDVFVDSKHAADKLLKKEGFCRYEVANYAKEGKEARHNTNYWKQGEYIGLGVSASSFVDGIRYTNIADIEEYIENIDLEKEIYNIDEVEDKESLMKEYVMLGLRLKEGVSKEAFKLKYKEDLEKKYVEEIKKLKEQGILEETEDAIYLTPRGLDLANVAFMEFV